MVDFSLIENLEPVTDLDWGEQLEDDETLATAFQLVLSDMQRLREELCSQFPDTTLLLMPTKPRVPPALQGYLLANKLSPKQKPQKPDETPPSLIGGSNLETYTEVGIDWLAGTASVNKMLHILAIVQAKFSGDSCQNKSIPFRGYAESLSLKSGAKFSWHPDRPEFHLQLTGSTVAALDTMDAVELMSQLHQAGMRFSRVDVRFDDFACRLLPSQLSEWAKAGYMCHFREHELKETYSGTKLTGQTFYAGLRGSKGSGVYYRAYDKRLESRGDIPSIRYEAEFSGKRAALVGTSIAEALANGVDAVKGLLEGLVLGCIDFRVGSKSLGFRDRSRLPEWQAFISDRPTVRTSTGRGPRRDGFPLDAFAWQYGPALARCYAESKYRIGQYVSIAIASGKRRGHGVQGEKSGLATKRLAITQNSLLNASNMDLTQVQFANSMNM